MKKLFLFLLAITISSCGAPDIPITKEEVTTIQKKLDQCISNLDRAQTVLEKLVEELQQCIDNGS